MKRVVAVNASPRSGWNTAQLVREAARGADDAGATSEVVDLYALDPFMGCRSCFACKAERSLGKCVYRDGLAGTLERMRAADALTLGSPNYLGRPTAGFRALYERLVFQYLTYKSERPSYNDRRIPILLIMTSNAAAEQYPALGYDRMMAEHSDTLERLVGPVSLLVAGNTQQVSEKAYERFDWTMFDSEAKIARHDAVWSDELARAREAGGRLVGD